MATTSDVKITPGTGENVATYSITEDTETKKLQRVSLNDDAGNELGTATSPINSKEIVATTATPSNASMSNSSATVLASNSSRLGAILFNDSTTTSVYIKFGSSASTTSFTVRMDAGAYLEVPFRYTGIITGITSSGTSTMRVTEITA